VAQALLDRAPQKSGEDPAGAGAARCRRGCQEQEQEQEQERTMRPEDTPKAEAEEPKGLTGAGAVAGGTLAGVTSGAIAGVALGGTPGAVLTGVLVGAVVGGAFGGGLDAFIERGPAGEDSGPEGARRSAGTQGPPARW
jgi:hypothetical protein